MSQPELITSSTEIFKKIRHIVAPDAGKRIVITAFVGADAGTIVGKTTDVDFYCWPLPNSTHPDGVLALMKCGRVWFVDNLHTKFYWSEHHGALIGSPNLTRNALGDGISSGKLTESAVYFKDGSALDVKAVLKTLGPRTPAEEGIAELRRLTASLGHSGSTKAKPQTIGDYMVAPEAWPWKVAFWTHRVAWRDADYASVATAKGVGTKQRAKDLLKHSGPAPWGTKVGEWILYVRWDGKRPSAECEWMRVDHVDTIKGRRTAYALKGNRTVPPFDLSTNGLKKSLKRFLADAPDGDGFAMTSARLKSMRAQLGEDGLI